MSAGDAEIDSIGQRRLHSRIRKQRECVAGNGAVVMGAADRIFQRPVPGHQADGMVEIGVGRFAALERTPPEFALFVSAATKREYDWQRDLAFAEIVADVFAEARRSAAVVEHVVDELERNAEIHTERAARGLLGLLPPR